MKKTGPDGSVFCFVWFLWFGLVPECLARRDGFFAGDGADDRGSVPGVDMDLWLALCSPCVGDGCWSGGLCFGLDLGLCVCFDGFEAFTHAAACFELDSPLCRHGDAFEGLWVLRHAWCAMLDFEDPEITELEAVAIGDFVDHLVKKLLDDLLCDDAFVACTLGDLVYKDFLCDRFHNRVSFCPLVGCLSDERSSGG